MKSKTIKTVLSKKHKDFVASITDPEVAKLVEKNSIITGGCIVSMLLGEKVNDFDYYFTDKETCLKVAGYFVAQFNARTGKSVTVEAKEDGRIKIFIRSAGVAHDEEHSDLPAEEPTTEFDDSNMEDLGLSEIKDATSEDQQPNSYRPIFLSANAISLSNKVQLVTRFYGNPEEIHSNYDFVHATCYWSSKDNELVLPKEALEAILTKELIYSGSKYPLCSIIRSKKFLLRGWQINAGQYLKMCLQLNELDLKDPAVLEEQLTGVDSAYFLHAISVIKKKKYEDPNFQMDTVYLFSIINRIFN
jgi:hypothetical protein